MSIDMVLFSGLGIFLIILFVIIYLKDVESNRKFERFARAIEDLNRQNHHLQQTLNKKKEEDKLFLDEMKLEVRQKIQEEINTNVLPLLKSLEDIDYFVQDYRTNKERIDMLEERTKSINALSQNATISHEKQIVHAYNSGKKLSDIAKDLRIGIGEVEFVLKMNELI